MRTLKKTLCLVLCLAMMVGLCAFGVHADFADAEEIENKEAVDLMAGIGVIEGYPDGSYDPAKIFNRAEAAKIISYLLLGKDAAEALPKANTQFTDVPASHWASGFIGYCADQGIVNGVGHDKFNPTGELTAAAWGKMLLCALGYNAEVEGMTGDGWDFNVTRLVSSTKLADGMAFSGKAPMSRDGAALLAFNALTIPMVYYKGGVNVSTKEGTTVSVNSELDTDNDYLAEKFGLGIANTNAKKFQKDDLAGVVKGVVTENSANAVVKTTELNKGTAYSIDTGIDLLGHYVKIVCKVTAGGAANPKAVVSISDIGTTTTVAAPTTNDATFKAAFGVAKEKIDLTAANKYTCSGGAVTAGIAIAAAMKAGDYIFDESGKIVSAIQSDFAVVSLDKVADVNTTSGKESITFATAKALSNTADNDVIREYDGIEKGDIVVLSKIGTIYTAAKAETVEGTISKVDKYGTITLDGTEYAASDGTNAVVTSTIPAAAADMKGKTYKLYLDGNGDYLACELTEGKVVASTAMYVTGTYRKTVSGEKGDVTSFYALAVDAAGEEKTFQISALGAVAAGSIYTFLPTATGVYTPTLVAQAAALNGTTVTEAWDTSATTTFKSTDKSYALTTAGKAYVNAKTIFVFVKNQGDADASQIKFELKTGPVNYDATGKAVKYLYGWDNSTDKNLIIKTVFVDGEYQDNGVDASTLLYVAAKDTKKTDFSTDGYTYTVYDAVTGEKKTIVNKADIDATNAQGFHKFSLSGELYNLDYAVATDTSIMYGQTYGGKVSNSLRTVETAYGVDFDTTNTIFVDVRAAKNIGTEGALTSLDAIAAAKDVKFDMIVDSKNNVKILFVTSATKES